MEHLRRLLDYHISLGFPLGSGFTLLLPACHVGLLDFDLNHAHLKVCEAAATSRPLPCGLALDTALGSLRILPWRHQTLRYGHAPRGKFAVCKIQHVNMTLTRGIPDGMGKS